MSRLPPPIATPDFADELAGTVLRSPWVVRRASRNARVRGPRRRSVVIGVATASLVGVLACGLSLVPFTARPGSVPAHAGRAQSLGLAPTNWAQPLPGAVQTTAAGAQAAVGFPVPLPHDPIASRGDLDHAWLVAGQVIDLVFDGGQVTIIMQRATYTDPAKWFRIDFAEIKIPGSAVLGQVNGQPAIIVRPRMDHDKSNPALVEFYRDGIDINVISTSLRTATLLRIADSMH